MEALLKLIMGHHQQQNAPPDMSQPNAQVMAQPQAQQQQPMNAFGQIQQALGQQPTQQGGSPFGSIMNLLGIRR